MDNYYTLIPLLKYFAENGIYYTRAIRKDRKGMPNLRGLIHKESSKNLFLSNGELALVLWHDKKLVTVISNYHKSEIILYSRWNKGNKENI